MKSNSKSVSIMIPVLYLFSGLRSIMFILKSLLANLIFIVSPYVKHTKFLS